MLSPLQKQTGISRLVSHPAIEINEKYSSVKDFIFWGERGVRIIDISKGKSNNLTPYYRPVSFLNCGCVSTWFCIIIGVEKKNIFVIQTMRDRFPFCFVHDLLSD